MAGTFTITSYDGFIIQRKQHITTIWPPNGSNSNSSSSSSSSSSCSSSSSKIKKVNEPPICRGGAYTVTTFDYSNKVAYFALYTKNSAILWPPNTSNSNSSNSCSSISCSSIKNPS